uniref:Uncharacterized protein n=1 Tax=Anguilla anguilla TaxID=7936 RepID=A0A0E9QJS7_ANGAN
MLMDALACMHIHILFSQQTVFCLSNGLELI